jgi:hypothetical protein
VDRRPRRVRDDVRRLRAARTALATSVDLQTWDRLGPVHYAYDDALGQDLNLRQNKDTTFFPEPVIGPDGRASLAVLHRPMGPLGMTNSGEEADPLWGTETRESIWIGFVDLAAAQADLHALTIWSQNRFVAGPEFAFEALKIGGGPPPVRVPEGWLVLHHGVTGHLEPGVAQQQRVHYAAGGMILDADEPWRLSVRVLRDGRHRHRRRADRSRASAVTSGSEPYV